MQIETRIGKNNAIEYRIVGSNALWQKASDLNGLTALTFDVNELRNEDYNQEEIDNRDDSDVHSISPTLPATFAHSVTALQMATRSVSPEVANATPFGSAMDNQNMAHNFGGNVADFYRTPHHMGEEPVGNFTEVMPMQDTRTDEMLATAASGGSGASGNGTYGASGTSYGESASGNSTLSGMHVLDRDMSTGVGPRPINVQQMAQTRPAIVVQGEAQLSQHESNMPVEGEPALIENTMVHNEHDHENYTQTLDHKVAENTNVAAENEKKKQNEEAAAHEKACEECNEEKKD